MHNFWFFFLKKRQFTLLLIAALVAIGIYSLIAIPKESAPEVTIPIGIITTVYPGTSAIDIEKLVTDKLEDAVKSVDDIDTLTSTSQDGVSSITVQFDANADIDKSIQKLRDAVDTVKSQLPKDASTPTVFSVSFADQPIHVISISSNLDTASFAQLGDKLTDEFKSVPGVSKVTVSGTRAKQVQVMLKQSALASFGLSINDIVTALSAANLTSPVGTITTDGVAYTIKFDGGISSVDEIRNIPIKAVNGNPVYIKDVATVIDGFQTQSSISRVSVGDKPSENAMTLSIYKKSGYDVTTMSAGVHAKLEQLEAPGELLADSQVLFVFDQGVEIFKDLSELTRAGFETVALVMICLLLTIGWRESIVAALSIPLSFVIAFFGLYISGNTINFISLFALILAVGILVDSGIVITEAIHTRTLKYGHAEEAAQAALKEYGWPLIGGTMTTIAVFAPLFFISGIVGKFISSIPFTIIFVLLASIFVALGFIPLIAIYFTRNAKQSQLEKKQEEYTHKAQELYRSFLVSFLKNKIAQRIFLWSLAVGLVCALLLPITGILKVTFFPDSDSDYLYVSIQTKEGTPLANTDLVVREVEEILYDKSYIESFSSTAGQGSEFIGNNGSGGSLANITIKLKDTRTRTSDQLSDDLRTSLAQIKDATISIQGEETGPPSSGAPVVIKLTGDTLSTLAEATDKVASLVGSLPGTRDVTIDPENDATQYEFTVDKAKASALGVSAASVAQVLRTAVFGVTATTYTVDGTDIDVVVKLALNASNTDPSAIPQTTVETLRNLTVTSISGQSVPLGSVMSETIAPANTSIDHEDAKRVQTVSAYNTNGKTAEEVVNEFKSKESSLNLPSDVTISYGGETEDINQSFTEMFVALIAGLVLMLAILVLAFNSIRYALYLLLAVPYSLIGVFFGLTLTGLSLSFISLLGVIALAGVIINHAIILMDSMITHKASTGEQVTLIDRVADAAVSRFRPIILTTITTVVGMIPLSLVSSEWGPLAYSIMFGLSFAMILTLCLIPTLYYRAELKKESKRQR